MPGGASVSDSTYQFFQSGINLIYVCVQIAPGYLSFQGNLCPVSFHPEKDGCTSLFTSILMVELKFIQNYFVNRFFPTFFSLA